MTDIAANQSVSPVAKEIDQVWVMETKKHKPVSFHVGGKLREFEVELSQGSYLFFAHTTAIIPGGDKGYRYVSVDFNVKSKSNETILHDVYKLHAGEKTLAVEFKVEAGHQATAFIRFRMNAPLGPIKVIAKLFRNNNPRISNDHFTEESLFKTISTEAIIGEMQRDSPLRQQAIESAMIRPFVLIASMHPAARQQMADVLGMALYGEEFEDGHAEAWTLISKNRKGMQASAMHSWESINPLQWKEGKGSNWFQCVYRVMTEVYKKDMTLKEEIKNFHSDEMRQASLQAGNPKMEELELRLLRSISKTFFNGLKDDSAFHMKLDEMMNSSSSSVLRDGMSKAGMADEEVFRFTVGFCLYLLGQRMEEDVDKQKLQGKEMEREEKELVKRQEREAKENEASNLEYLGDSRIRPFHYEGNPEQFLKAVKEQLLLGSFDPRSTGQKGVGAAKKAGTFLGKQALKKFVLVPFFPPLVLPFMIGGIVVKLIGSKHEKLFVVVVQILLQRLLLSAHGININSYY